MRYAAFVIGLVTIGCLSCGSPAPEERFKEEVANVEDLPAVDLKLLRLDHDIYRCTPANINTEIMTLRQQYGDFFDAYVFAVARIARPDDPLLDQKILHYIGDPDITKIHNNIDSTFNNFDPIYKQLQQGFTRYKHFFPNKNIPTVVTYFSGLNENNITTQNELGIGLDRYLGRNYFYYVNMPDRFPLYKLVNASKEYVASDALFNWCVTEFNDSTSAQLGNTLLGEMIYNGKILFLTDALLPDVADSIKLRYTAEQTKWCKNNEVMIWTYLVDTKQLYVTDGKTKSKYMADAPFTPGMPRESPGRIGAWVGWQIVKAYMAKKPNLTMADLFKENDAQKILAESGYRPK